MEITFNLSSILLTSLLTLSLVVNFTLAVNLYNIKIGKTDKSKKRIDNKKSSTGDNINTGDHSPITIIKYVRDAVGTEAYQEATEELTDKSRAFENDEINWDKQLSRFESIVEGSYPEVTTGFINIDRPLSRIEASQLISLHALPGSGKTTFALDVTRHNAISKNIPILFFSLNTTTQLLVERMIGAEARVDAHKLRTGRIRTEDEFSRLKDSLEKLAKAPIFIDDTPYSSFEKIKRKILNLQDKIKNGIIIIDDVELLSPEDDQSKLLADIKRLASTIQLPIMVTAHIPRIPFLQRGGHPRLSDLPEPYVKIPDIVITLTESYKYDRDSNVKHVDILKNRNGRCTSTELYHDTTFTTFLDIEENEFEDFESGDF